MSLCRFIEVYQQLEKEEQHESEESLMDAVVKFLKSENITLKTLAELQKVNTNLAFLS